PVHQVNASSVQNRNGVYYQFFTVPVGNLREGYYEVQFIQNWSEPVNDGFNDYGPGTAVPEIKTTCNFQVELNPVGANVVYSGMYIGGQAPPSNFRQRIEEEAAIRNFIEANSTVGQRDGTESDSTEVEVEPQGG
ncbi:MAG: hypothetical protein AAF125_27175, partial [Chloroflexota bacterium]